VRPLSRPAGRGSAAQARRGGIPPWLAGLAAGVALVAGLGIGRLTGGDPAPPTPEAQDPGAVVAAADLTALDSDADRGVARAVQDDDTLTLRVSARELADDGGFHEVWLLNVDGTRMVALGVLADGDTGEFQVPRGLLDEGYRIVDISVEPDDGDPTHSGVSLARGELA
jgi:anti-sigma-K factor RskA